MAPRKGNALKEVNTNVMVTAVTPRREISALKKKNEELEASLANLTAQLEQVSLSQAPTEASTKSSTNVQVISPPDFRHLEASLPEAPARPTPAFTYFSNDMRKTSDMKNIKATEQSKIIGQKWRELSEEQKAPYIELHENDKVRYEQQMKKYQAVTKKVELERKALQMHYESKKQAAAMQCYENLLAAQHESVSTSKKEVKTSDLAAPKKPKTAFNFFCAYRRDRLLKKNADAKLDLGDSMKLFSAEWSKLKVSKSGKKQVEKFEKMAVQDKERYAAELQEYSERMELEKAQQLAAAAKELEKERRLAMKTFAPVVKAEEAAEEQRKLARKEKKEKRLEKELAPKRAKSAYIFFTMAKREELVAANPSLSQAEIMSELGRWWSNASVEEKTPFEKLAAEDRERYAAEIQAYNAQKVES